MTVLDGLSACAGRWRGRNALHDPDTGGPDESPGTATVTPVLNGRFVRLDYTWGYQGKPQEGTMLIGFEQEANRVTAQWADTWHMSDKVMSCAGPSTDGKALAFTGSYAAPPGPDWGWRIEVTPRPDALRIRMVNMWPEGKEELARGSELRAGGRRHFLSQRQPG
ncbi:MAG: DUF1579 family protein [Thermoanaerobaculia bacterium]